MPRIIQLTKKEKDELIKAFDENNNQRGKCIKPTMYTTGRFKAISITGKPVIGLLNNFDSSFAHVFLNIAGKECEACYVRTISYQSNMADKNGTLICEGDIIFYKEHYRVVEAERNGSDSVYFTFRRIRSNEKLTPMPLTDIAHKRDKIIIVGNVFDDIEDTSVYDMASGKTIQGIGHRLQSLSPENLNEIICHLDIIDERNIRLRNGVEYPMPIQTGEKTMVEIEITDENKAFDFFGKSLTGRSDMSEYGFEVTSLSFSKDRYLETIEKKLRDELLEIAGKATTEFYTNVNRILSKKDEVITSLDKLNY